MPFLGKEKSCTYRDASVRPNGFTISTMNMAVAGNSARVKVMLRTMGPVAAEISASSPTFKFYSSGIIDD